MFHEEFTDIFMIRLYTVLYILSSSRSLLFKMKPKDKAQILGESHIVVLSSKNTLDILTLTSVLKLVQKLLRKNKGGCDTYMTVGSHRHSRANIKNV